MRYLNQLEPDSFIDEFAAHPPLGFRIEPVAETPSFVAPFDLLTTTQDSVRKHVSEAPGYRWWGRLLRWRTTFVGTTVSEYALFPREADAEHLPDKLLSKLGRRQRLLIVKDIPQASPLLDTAANDWSARFTAACIEAGYVLLEGQALACRHLIDFADEAEYLGRLSCASRRKDIRRKLRRRDEVKVETIRCGDMRFFNEAAIDAYYMLYSNVYQQSEIHFDQLSRNFLAAILRDAGSGGIMFVYRHKGAMIGWNLCYVNGDKLIDKYVRFRLPAGTRTESVLHQLVLQSRLCARKQGLAYYVAGWTDPQIKAYLGARFTLTQHAVYLRNRPLRALTRRLSKRFESDSRWARDDAQS